MGFAASHQAWAPQVADLLLAPADSSSSSGGGSANGNGSPARPAAVQQQQQQQKRELRGQQQQQAEQADGGEAGEAEVQLEPSPCVVCVLDNRGVGHSTAPTERRDYSTPAMAEDALQVRLMVGAAWELV